MGIVRKLVSGVTRGPWTFTNCLTRPEGIITEHITQLSLFPKVELLVSLNVKSNGALGLPT